MSTHVCLPLLGLVQGHGARVTTTCESRTVTGQLLHDRVALLSWGLSHVYKIAPGDRIALLGLNSDTFFVAVLAVLDAGAVTCPMNWRWSETEVAAAIDLTQPMLLLADEACMQLACSAQARASHATPVLLLDSAAPPAAAAAMMNAEPLAGHRISIISSIIDSSRGSSSQPKSLQELLAAAAAAHQAAAWPQQQQPLFDTAPIQQQHTQKQPQHIPQLQLLQPCKGEAAGAALICFTSGTTGASKGALLSHASIMHQSMAKLAVVQYSSDDVYLHVAPLFHIGGLSSAFAVLLAGGSHVFMPRYSASTALQLIRQHQVTAMIAVPAMMQDIVTAAATAAQISIGQRIQQQQQQAQLQSLRRVLVGAGGMSQQLQQAVTALFPNAQLSTAYGMTEGSSSITFISLPQQQQLMAAAAAGGAAAAAAAGVCVGWPAPGIAVRVQPAAAGSDGQQQQQHMRFWASNTGSSSSVTSNIQQQQQQQSAAYPSPLRIVGEVCTRGAHVMQGYWRAPDATAQTLSPDGWLRTGDLGYLDASGCLWLLGRAKDMVKSGGENVHAAEVEGVLLRHPGVAAAAVVGLPHVRLGEQVAAAVVLRQGWSWQAAGITQQQLQQQGDRQQQQQQVSSQAVLQQQQEQQQVVSEATLQQHCRAAGLSAYKLPRVVVQLQGLPLNSSGKVVKAAVQEQMVNQQHLLHGRQPAGTTAVVHRSRL